MSMVPFRLKICGVRDGEILTPLAEAGGDAIGLNFFPRSIRYTAPNEAAEIAGEAKRLGLITVGLFVNESLESINAICEACHLDWVQLHGDESIELAQSLIAHGHPVIRAVRLPGGPILPEQIEKAVRPWSDAGCAILLDADAGHAFGGQGLRLDWGAIRRWATIAGGNRCAFSFVLAGGLDPENVRDAILQSGASGVDVASGVEAPRGHKSVELVVDWTRRAIQGFDSNTLPTA